MEQQLLRLARKTEQLLLRIALPFKYRNTWSWVDVLWILYRGTCNKLMKCQESISPPPPHGAQSLHFSKSETETLKIMQGIAKNCLCKKIAVSKFEEHICVYQWPNICLSCFINVLFYKENNTSNIYIINTGARQGGSSLTCLRSQEH